VAAAELPWFEVRPLHGRRVVVTRTRRQASALSAALADLGAVPVEIPTIAVEPPADGGTALAAAAERLAAGTYDWLVLTSPNGVERFFEHVPDSRAVRAAVAAIGPGTAAALAERRIVADLLPERFVAESLLEAFPAGPGRVLLAQAAAARPVLADGLAAAGWEVDAVEAYRTVPVVPDPAAVDALADADAITFTSGSSVEHFVAAFGVERVPPVVACIGPVTSEAARRLGITVDVEAAEATIPGLAAAVATALGG